MMIWTLDFFCEVSGRVNIPTTGNKLVDGDASKAVILEGCVPA